MWRLRLCVFASVFALKSGETIKAKQHTYIHTHIHALAHRKLKKTQETKGIEAKKGTRHLI